MADKGNLASFKFGVVYSTADCLSAWNFNNSINDIVYQCAGYDKHIAGTKSVNFNVSLGLAATDTTKVTALAPGTTNTFEAHPGGDATSRIEITSTRGIITQSNISAPMNGIISMDVIIALDNVTLTTAA